MTFRLRKAEESDLDFIWRLRVATMKESVSQSYGWDEETQRGYAAESLRGEIVLIDEKPVGVLTLADWGDQMHLVWMAILPEAQRQGLSRRADRALPAEGSRSRKTTHIAGSAQ